MPDTLARPDDVRLDTSELAAATFLVTYKNPTRRGYEMSLREWFRWCAGHGVTPLTAARPMIELWCRQLEEERHLKPATINGKLTAVLGFYRFAKLDGYIDDDPGEHVRRPKIPPGSSTQGLTRGELLACLEVAKAASHRDHAFWCLLSLSGLRVGEACRLDVDDLGWEREWRTVRLVRSKSGRVQVIPLAARTSHAIDRHLGTRKSGPLFLKPRVPDRLDQKSANRIVKRVARVAGVDKRITPHSLRHTFTTVGLNAGVHPRDLANSRGDTDLRAVSYYDREKDALERNATHMVAAYISGA